MSALARRVEGAFYAPDGSTGSAALDGTLQLASSAFALALRVRSQAWKRGWLRASPAPLPVVCVGNLTVGGSGKTPVVAALAAGLAARGRRPAVLARGYGARPRLRASRRVEALDPARFGDEPVLLAARLAGLPVYVGPSRIASALLAYEGGADVALLDDGFQHRRLARDVDVVVVDGGRGFGNGWVLPRGPLREPVSGLARAHLVLLKRPAAAGPWDRLVESGVRHLAGDVPVRAFGLFPTALVAPDGRREPVAVLAGRRVVAVAGIGHPDAFRATLEGLGAAVVAALAYPDHHAYGVGDAEHIRAAADRGRTPADLVVTTEKDARKLAAVLADARLRWLEVEARTEGGFDLAGWVLDRLPPR